MTETRRTPAAEAAPPTAEPRPELDHKIERLGGRKKAWAALPVDEKIEHARALLAGTLRVARGQVEAAAAAKGVPLASAPAAEDWLSGPYIQARTLRLLIRSLEEVRDEGRVRIDPARILDRPGGRVAVSVFPDSLLDRLLYGGFSAEVWMRPGVTRDNLGEQVGGGVLRPDPEGAVALVLGAGNVASIGPLDVVHKLFNEGRVALLKFNPVNEYLGPFVEDAFSGLIDAGFVDTAYGGADVGEYLCFHPGVDEIHITGSARTHDVIVFGPGAEGAARKAAGRPRLGKRITSELGNVSPTILVPGDWSEADLRFQAQNVATQMVQNGGFNCNATKVLVTHEAWPQRRRFLDLLGEVLAALPARPAYYPGAEERFETFLAAYPQARVYGERRPGEVPPALAAGVDPENRDGLAFTSESFCAFTAETALPAKNAARFLEAAVEFCNERLYGTLNAGIILHPATGRALGGRLEEAVAALRYGSVGVNHWPAMSYALGSTTWGAYPGATLDDIQSGIGVVHNARLFDAPEKSVIRGPFRVFPKPVWFVTHRGAHRVGPRLVALEGDPSLARVPGIVIAALSG